MVQVHLTVAVFRQTTYVTIEDRLPAGLEVLDTSLKTTSATATTPSLRDSNTSRYFWWYINHAEVRDDQVTLFARSLPPGIYEYTYLARATTPGTFNVLPPQAYQMYTPDVFGQGADTRSVVIDEE